MFNITVPVTLELAQALEAYAKAEDLPIDQAAMELIEKGLGIKTAASPMTVWEAVVIAIEKANKLPAGSKFLLADTLPSELWNQLAPGDRKMIGKKFKQQLEKDGVAKFSHRRSDNHAVYIKL
ncbi:DUF1413 domain-containing protein [Achromobacter xylosoxidans]|uniref:DUF1413 domain-containing protein n=1 Tax=Alcaligenes xylosoxydans xylosoxydans TaxID=85698 RepID=UPI001F0535CE|nr:DUF1413 domain-containing protein [Achromobacter xylosoxidans]MCH1985492.1 single-stranded DNA-binding protein [Achromobacter xylosoxidans]MCH1994364.1 single-stranded DNA-binding protein [Achromobacter xylosoxidans]MCH4585161.1 single-stranded DNA-binding protein [Achromobacter xylosoxidans]